MASSVGHLPGRFADHDTELDLRVDVRRQRPVPGERVAVARRRSSVPCRRRAAAPDRWRRSSGASVVQPDRVDRAGIGIDGPASTSPIERHPPCAVGPAHRSGPYGRVGEERRDGGPHHVGHAAHAGPAFERDGRLLDEHLGAVRGAQAARACSRAATASPAGRRRGRRPSRRAGKAPTSIVAPVSIIPTVVALTARSADRERVAQTPRRPDRPPCDRPARRHAKRSRKLDRRRRRRFPTVTRLAPARRHANTTACAAPPAPATTTSVPPSGRAIASSTPARKPGASVLNPTRRPSSVRDHVVHGPDRIGVLLDLVDQRRRPRACTAPSPPGPASPARGPRGRPARPRRAPAPSARTARRCRRRRTPRRASPANGAAGAACRSTRPDASRRRPRVHVVTVRKPDGRFHPRWVHVMHRSSLNGGPRHDPGHLVSKASADRRLMPHMVTRCTRLAQGRAGRFTRRRPPGPGSGGGPVRRSRGT